MSIISKKEFDELVGNTTHYLQDLLNRVASLEKQVAELEKAKPQRTTRTTEDK